MLKKIIHTLFFKGSAAGINFLIFIITTKALGAELRGEIAVFILNISIIQTVNEIYSGYTLIHFIPKFSLKKIYRFGFLWVLGCTLVLSFLYFILGIRMGNNWMHLFSLSFIIILHSFHLVLILGKGKIMPYNVLSILQPVLLILSLLVFIFLLNIRSFDAYVACMYISFIPSIIASSIYVYKELKHSLQREEFLVKKIFTNGGYNQFAALTHTLSNRYNYYLFSTNALVGIYSTASSFIEALLLISGSVTPFVLSHVANSNKHENNKALTFTLAKLCFLLSACCVAVLYFIPNAFFVSIVGAEFAGVKRIMLLLSPGILCLSFSSIIVHYYSAMGKQKVIATANVCGLITTVSVAYFFIASYGITGACYTANLSYFVTSLILAVVFMYEHRLKFKNLLEIRKDIYFIKNNRNV